MSKKKQLLAFIDANPIEVDPETKDIVERNPIVDEVKEEIIKSMEEKVEEKQSTSQEKQTEEKKTETMDMIKILLEKMDKKFDQNAINVDQIKKEIDQTKEMIDKGSQEIKDELKKNIDEIKSTQQNMWQDMWNMDGEIKDLQNTTVKKIEFKETIKEMKEEVNGRINQLYESGVIVETKQEHFEKQIVSITQQVNMEQMKSINNKIENINVEKNVITENLNVINNKVIENVHRITLIGTKLIETNKIIEENNQESHCKIEQVHDEIAGIKSSINNNSMWITQQGLYRNQSTGQENEASNIKGIMQEIQFGFNSDKIMKFQGDGHRNPRLFLKNLRDVTNKINDLSRLKSIIRHSLKGEAENWLGIIEDDYRNFAEFEQLFLRQYWGISEQRKVRINLNNGKYNDRRDRTKESYAIKYINEAKQLDPPMFEIDIIRSLANHYEDEVINRVAIENIESTEQFINLLKRFDTIQSTSGRENINNNNIRNNNNTNQNFNHQHRIQNQNDNWHRNQNNNYSNFNNDQNRNNNYANFNNNRNNNYPNFNNSQNINNNYANFNNNRNNNYPNFNNNNRNNHNGNRREYNWDRNNYNGQNRREDNWNRNTQNEQSRREDNWNRNNQNNQQRNHNWNNHQSNRNNWHNNQSNNQERNEHSQNENADAINRTNRVNNATTAHVNAVTVVEEHGGDSDNEVQNFH